jgi:hypothetical protein
MRHVLWHQHDIFVDTCRTLCDTSVSFCDTVQYILWHFVASASLCHLSWHYIVSSMRHFVATFHQKIHFFPAPFGIFVSTCDTLWDNDVRFYRNFNILWHSVALCDALSPHSTLYLSSMPYFVATCHQKIHFVPVPCDIFCLYMRHFMRQWCVILSQF